MTRLFPCLLLFLLALATPVRADSGLKILVVVGTGGTEEYEVIFKETAALWTEAAKKGETAIEIIGLEDGEADDQAERLRESIAAEKSPELWVVLIGHGTFDGRVAKFNVRGPDFTDEELAGWLADYPGALSLINTASASGSYIREMAKPGRVIITATKNEGEISFTRFGRFFAEAVGGLLRGAGGTIEHDRGMGMLGILQGPRHSLHPFGQKLFFGWTHLRDTVWLLKK